jgi:hypothetical protein
VWRSRVEALVAGVGRDGAVGGARRSYADTSPSRSNLSRLKSTRVLPSVSTAQKRSSGRFVLLNPDDNERPHVGAIG